jgi:hypothetical protein
MAEPRARTRFPEAAGRGRGAGGGAAYELGVRERDHALALQPYPDGPQAPD